MEPNTGLELTTLRSKPDLRSSPMLNQLRHPGTPIDIKLLDYLLDLEQEFKRVRLFKNGPRTLDLDLLLYEDLIMDTSKLTLPHPRMCERAFVLIPLNEIAPSLIIPKSERSVSSFYASLSDADFKDVRLLEHA